MYMRKLKDSYWEQFTCYTSFNKKIRDGIKFENLVEKLLEIEYGTEWVRTAKTHDDSRDFYLMTTDYMQWAECKNYNTSISLETIAPTLVMAQIFDVNKIIFFSYSEINRFAKKKVHFFGEKTGKKIEVFAGNTLDELIIKNKNLLPISFRPTTGQINNNKNPKVIESYFQFIQTPILGISEEDKLAIHITDVKKIIYNEPFEIDFICVNNTLNNSYNIEISLAHDKGIDNYYFTPVNIDFIDADSVHAIKELPSAGGIVLRYCFKSNVFRTPLMLPVFKVTVRNGNNIIEESFSPVQKVQNEWIGKTILIGDQYRNILKNTERMVLNNDTVSCLTVYGSSGTGKTRLMNESLELLLKHKYRILNFIGNEEDSAYILLKELIYFIFEVPGDEILLEMQKNEFFEKIVDMNRPANQAYHLAQCFNHARSTGELIEIINTSFDIIFEKLSKERIAIMIDNVQYFGKALTHFIKKYLIYSKHQTRKNCSVIFLSINLDYATEDTEQLLKYIKELSKDYRQIKYHYIGGFQKENNGILFLRELLQLKDDSLDAELKAILNKTSLKPYYIYQAVYYLFEKKAIEYIKDRKGYIVSMERFQYSIKKMPSTINCIIEQRWNSFLKENHVMEEHVQLIVSAVYLFIKLNFQTIILLNLSEDLIRRLIQRNFLRKDENGIISFDHDIIENFLENFYPDIEKKIIEHIRNCHTIRKLSGYVFIYNFYRLFHARISYKLIEEIYKATPFLNIPSKLIIKYYNRLLELVLKKRNVFPSSNEWMRYIQNICDFGKEAMGIRKAEQLFQRANYEIENADEQKIYLTASFRNYMNKYADLLFYQKKYLAAIEYLLKINLIIEQFSAGNEAFNALRSMIYNRLYINYRELNLTSYHLNAQHSLKCSKEYVAKLENPLLKDEFTYLNISDEGYDFYCLCETKDILLSIWEQCMKYPPERLPQKAMNYFRKSIQICLIKHQPLQALEKISEATNYMRLHPELSNEKLVFTFSFSLYQIVARIMEHPIKNKLYLMEELKLSYQLSELMDKKNWVDLLNLHAIICFYNGDTDGVYYHFKESYEAYSMIKTSLFYKERRKLLLDNIFIAFSKLKILQQAENFLVTEDMNYVINHKAKDTSYEALGILQTSDRLFNLPCI